MNRRRRQAGIALALSALLGAGVVAGVAMTGSAVPAPAQAAVGDGEGPAALSRHMEKLRQAVPGNGGESREGPGSAADDDFAAKAYPAKTISVAKAEASRKAFKNVQKRFPKGKNRKGTWVTVGPSEALYPFTEFRNSGNYVPNAYVAGGRTTAIAISDRCTKGRCRLYVTPAGGGVWRTDNALAKTPKWRYLAGPFGINAAGSVTIDPNDRSGDTVYVGTGEANTCGSGCVAGVGIYKSTNAGRTWTGPLGQGALGGKGIGQIVVTPRQPKVLYAATTTALRGMSSVCCSGVTRPVPDAAKWGLYKSVDSGKKWTFIHNGSTDSAQCTGSQAEFANTATCSPRGVREVALDPNNPRTVYATSYARGVWRSTNAGRTWTQIKPSLNPAVITTRPAMALAALPNGKTRMYLYEGNVGTPYSRLFRSDSVATGVPVFQDLTSANPADDGYATYNQCGGQCWYDQFVHSPKGHPDIVYTGGAYVYDETGGLSNGRGVVLSTDAGVSGTDMTMDGTDPVHPNGLHPDQHAMVTNPNNPLQFFEANDGGVMRSSGDFVDRSSYCDDRTFSGAVADIERDRCEQLLSRVPSRLEGINKGLTTLQFMSLSVDPRDVDNLQGGTQDNGTWESGGKTRLWKNTMIGDGGQSGFDVAKPNFRFHNFFDATTEVNFDSGDIGDWIWTADPIFGQPGTQFYAPVISDPTVSGTLFAGTGRTVFRTKTHGLGTRSLAEANRVCNTWTGTFEAQCGDWVPAGSTDLTADAYGDRAGGAVSAIERTPGNRGTAWAATTTGRLFYSRNVDAEPASSVVWTRVDDKAANDPNRFVSSIYVDPASPRQAYVSYSGYSLSTPTTPGHVFKVRANGRFTDLSADLADLPVTDLVLDPVSGDLYASSDFGVVLREAGTSTWVQAAPGMPNVEVAGLTIVPGERVLYAATHGLGAWRLNLP